MSDDLFENAPASSGDYDSSSIEVLEGLEPVRRRPGMYIGGTDDRALHHLAAEVLDNSMDEAVAGHANRIAVRLDEGNRSSISDNGRGTPADESPKFPGKYTLEVILSTLHSGGKFSGKAYATSGGLHGVGVSVVNALSSHTRVEVARDKQLFAQEFARGQTLGRSKSWALRPIAVAQRSVSRPIRIFSATGCSNRPACSNWPGQRRICLLASKSAGNAHLRWQVKMYPKKQPSNSPADWQITWPNRSVSANA